MKSHTLRLLLACLWCWATLIPLRVQSIPLWVFAGGGAAESDSPGTTNLLAWWAMENNLDSSGNARNLSEAGTVTNSAGLVNNAAYNDSTSDYLGMASASWQNPAGDFSIGLWIKPDDGRPAAADGLIGKWNLGSNRAYLMTLGTDGKINALISSDNSTVASLVTSTTTLADGAAGSWTFLVMVFDASTSFKLYVNGVSENPDSTSIPASVFGSTSDFEISTYNTTSGNTFLGGYDEVFFYSRVLTDAEITWLYNAGAGRTFSDL